MADCLTHQKKKQQKEVCFINMINQKNIKNLRNKDIFIVCLWG